MRPPDAGTTTLAPLVRALPIADRDGDGRWVLARPDDGIRLVVGAATMARDDLARIAADGGDEPAVVSRSATTGTRAVLHARSGRAGLDIETLARVALNAGPADAWLALVESARIVRSGDPVLEIACCWVLKEAYGKALGVGLALPLDRLVFGARGGMVVLGGAAAPDVCERWAFRLYRHAGVLLALAWSPQDQPTPLAPAGRKPPMPLLDR